jgi:hypothetical protein
MRSQVNMMQNNMPCHLTKNSIFSFLNHGVTDYFLSQHAMMYMFVNCICIRYINACIHLRLNPRLHGNTLRF